MTVFMVPPLDIGLKVSHESIRCREGIVGFLASVMAMIALAALVVIPDHALTGNDVGQSVLERVTRRRERCGQTPNDHLGERIGG
jgi:hypothetical protein